MPATVFFSYSHKDQRLRDELETHLSIMKNNQEIESWHDRKITAGQEWAEQIDENLRTADLILLLVSADFLASRYCWDVELKLAMERHERGEAVVIPILLKPVEWEDAPFGKLQACPTNARPITEWSSRDKAFVDVVQAIREAVRQLPERQPTKASAAVQQPSIQSPEPVHQADGAPSVDPVAALDIPEGPVRQDSAFYIHPADEARCTAELDKPGALIRIKSPKGFGKSSLTARLLAYASGKGYRTVALNLEGTDQKFFENTDRFMQWFCASVGKGLGLRVRTEEYWDDIFGANDNSTDYFEKYLLTPDPTPLVLAIDNFDRVFAHAAIETDFCGLLRSWNERARSNPLWERFRLVLSHSQESYLQKDINQSPFNVGLPVELGELPPEAVANLVALHGLQLSEAELAQLRELVGGHPYLVRKALYELANGLPLARFLAEAPTEGGVYGDHLRGILKAVEDHPELGEGLRQVVNSSEPVMLRSEQAFKLESLGVLVPEGKLVRPRCRLYASYLADRLAH
ncbi:AAA-like domain-containing protein [Cyanobium sp. FGCU-6]|nr:AAA-like domain-containing protein [Cyanobium sp. FGCU6]